MTTYAWPGTWPFIPSAMVWGVRPNGRASTSPLSGYTQTNGLPGSRWALSLDFPKHSYAERAQIEGFFNRLNGQEHRVSIWDLARSTPLALGGAPLVNGALAQFATTLAIDGTFYAGRNLLRYTQALDNAAWTKTNVTITANATTAPDGTSTADKIAETAITGSHSVLQAAAGTTVGNWYTAAISLKAAERTWALIIVDGTAGAYFDLSAGAFGTVNPLLSVRASNQGSGWWRVEISRTAVTTGLTMAVAAVISNGSSSFLGVVGNGIYAWGAQVEAGSVATDYTGLPAASQGDWLSLPLSGGGNQLVQVVNTPTPADAAITGIEFRPMLRGAVADNAAVTIVNPSALFILANPDIDYPRGANGICPPFSVDLIEVFA